MSSRPGSVSPDAPNITVTEVQLKATVEAMVPSLPAAPVESESFRWAMVPEEKRPAGPRMDLISQRVPLTWEQLEQRWEGIEGAKEEIYQLRMHVPPDMRAEMTLKRMMENGEAPLKISDPAFQERMAANDYIVWQAMSQIEAGHFLNGREPIRERVLDESSGKLRFMDSTRAMKSNERNYSARTLEIIQKAKHLIAGQATDIVQVQNVELTQQKKEAVAKELKDFRQELRGRKKVTVREVTVEELPDAEELPSLPQGRTFESEVLP